MKITVPTTATPLISLLTATQIWLIEQKKQLWMPNDSNYWVELYYTWSNNIAIDTIETATLLTSRPLIADVWFSFSIRNLNQVSLIADVESDIFLTVV